MKFRGSSGEVQSLTLVDVGRETCLDNIALYRYSSHIFIIITYTWRDAARPRLMVLVTHLDPFLQILGDVCSVLSLKER